MHTEMTGSEWKWRIWSSVPLHYAADGVQAKPGQASPKRKREREWVEKRRWMSWRERRVRDEVFICLFNLQEYTCFLFFGGPLWVAYGRVSWSSFLSSAFLLHPPILPSWGYTWAQPWRHRPQLTRCQEKRSRGHRREKVMVQREGKWVRKMKLQVKMNVRPLFIFYLISRDTSNLYGRCLIRCPITWHCKPKYWEFVTDTSTQRNQNCKTAQ